VTEQEHILIIVTATVSSFNPRQPAAPPPCLKTANPGQAGGDKTQFSCDRIGRFSERQTRTQELYNGGVMSAEYAKLRDAIICRNSVEIEYRKLAKEFVALISTRKGRIAKPARFLTKEDIRQLREADRKRVAARKAEMEALETFRRSGSS
jgi:hypothetical protein